MRLVRFERVDLRWRLHLELPSGVALSGLTAGLLTEDGRPLGPAVVTPAPDGTEVTVDVRGPCTLPQGTVARITLDIVGESPIAHDLLVASRRGFHAWLHADTKLSVESEGKLEGLTSAHRRALAAEWCWMAPDPATHSPCNESVPDEMADLLRDLGVDVDEISPEVREQLRGR